MTVVDIYNNVNIKPLTDMCNLLPKTLMFTVTM